MSKAMFVYVTCPSLEEAQSIARAIVEQRHAACANIIPAVASIYHWQGKIESAQETVLVFKTAQDKWQGLQDALKALHPYEVPCIIALPIEQGYAPYLQWIADETR
jgi:periplasmic divalent cation tolerance protein